MKSCGRQNAPPVELSLNLHNNVDSSSWFGSMNLYAGAFILILHGLLHHSVRPIAHLTLGICFVVEVYFLIKFLNKCLQFEFIVNIPKLVVEKCFLSALSLVLTVVVIFFFSSKLSQLSKDELLLVFMPSVFLGINLFPFCDYTNFQKFLSGFALAILFGVCW